MRIARFAAGGEVRYGVVASAGVPAEGSEIAELAGHPLGAMGSIRLTGTRYSLADVRLLAPSCPARSWRSARIMPRTRGRWAARLPDEPVIFLKPSTSVIGPADPIIRPAGLSQRVDFEGELAVVIGKIARNLRPSGPWMRSSATPAPTT